MKNTFVSSHPFVQWMLTEMRDERTRSRDFHRLVLEISRLLLFEACRNLKSRATKIRTPTGELTTGYLPSGEILVAPVLRAGIGMGNAAMECIPGVRVRHIGLQRDEKTFCAESYYEKRPQGVLRKDTLCIVVDPMIATGGSASDALDRVKAWGARRIFLVGIIAAPEGIKVVNKRHPDVQITVAAIDRGLNNQKFILPGLGDAGDRQFNT